MCDIAHALILERVEGDQRAIYAASGMVEEGREEIEPEHARARFESWLVATEADRRAGISDEEWELRLGLNVGLGR